MNAMAKPVLRRRHRLVRLKRCRTVANVPSIRFDVRDVIPVFIWQVVERQQRVPFLDRLVPFHAVDCDEEVEGGVRLGFCLGLPGVMQMAPGLGLDRFRRRPMVARTRGATGTTIQHVYRLVVRGSACSSLNWSTGQISRRLSPQQRYSRVVANTSRSAVQSPRVPSPYHFFEQIPHRRRVQHLSAKSFFSFAFSSSSAFSRLASETVIPPNFASHA